ncbi:probable glutamate--tRNA ligase, mitochondrial [Penaeus japonicus]|uniref:probable glutamate--tRNA ligase, mitochondrial n=1 Tax=Penaeus japonicus TaxID=27405 RepID=UPI001C70E28E|nr:probable glutamate--tRNA ligase, mitochondrial [Penaeus japonicus]XP_042889819.1 probable glutamate--tRNA ligase, mitochondrial [Penaeus japonicus]
MTWLSHIHHAGKITPSRWQALSAQLRKFSSTKLVHSEVRVRFAPSPTGHLHLGGLRTALYNFLFAKSNNGKFILRIEDTDQARLVPQAARKLEDILNWSKIPPDESPLLSGPRGPYVQSERIDLYQKHIQTLLENGSAYKCFCTDTRLDLIRKDALRRRETPKYDNRCRSLSFAKIEEFEKQGRPYCIRFKLEDITEPFHDLVYGSILYNVAQQEGDPVLLKSDGFPTYHFANVVDDYLMEVTHVLRGVEWQISTPKHLLLYKAFGWEPPQFAHLPLIKNKDGTKLSKRQGDLHIERLQAQGYSPEAIINFVTDIGGGFEDRDHNALMTVEELTERFCLSRVTTNSCRLDMEKINWFNQMDLQRRLQIPKEQDLLVDELRHLVQMTYGISQRCCAAQDNVLTTEYLTNVLLWGQKRITRLDDLVAPEFTYIWVIPEELPLDQLPQMSCSHADVLQYLLETIVVMPPEKFTKEQIPKYVKLVAKWFSLKTPVLMKLVRMAISGQKEGPPVGEMLSILGKETTIERLKHAYALLDKR